MTLLFLDVYEPRKLIVVAERNDMVTKGLNHATAKFAQVSVGRRSFDDSNGALAVDRLATLDTKLDPQGPGLKTSLYLAFGAAGALLKYMEESESVVLMANSLHNWLGPLKKPCDRNNHHLDMHMQLNHTTVESLELLGPTCQPSNKRKCSSLFQVMNRTKTACGSRLLRSHLLQPLTDIETLSCRYDCVQELVADDEMMFNVGDALAKFPRDMDKMCGNLVIRPSVGGGAGSAASEASLSRKIASLINSMILLKDVLSALSDLATALGPCRCDLLRVILANCSHPTFTDLLEVVQNVLDGDAKRSRSTLVKRIEQCYAVKGGMDGFLDLARANFCRITEQIHDLADSYKDKNDISGLKVSYNAKRGFYITTAAPGTKTKNGTAKQLPRGFLILEKRGRGVLHCTTHELIALNSRLKDATNDCMVLTQQGLEGAASTVLQHIGMLRKLIDNLSLLDMLFSFALVVTSSKNPYVRPRLQGEGGPIAIQQGRHPILERNAANDVQPNDTFISDCMNCHIITGPNMSGKSTYLKQVALIIIMAQVGCFVPADFVSFTPCDRLFTRIGTLDSIETNSSSFMVEMQEMAQIMINLTKRSLVIIDELGRATSTADGVGIAWAVCEKFISTGTHALLATHFGRLPDLARLYPSCKVHRFEVSTSRMGLNFSWKLKPAVPAEKDEIHYGIMLARIVSFPDEVLTRATKIAKKLFRETESVESGGEGSGGGELAVAYSVAQKVMCISAQHKKFEEDGDVDLARVKRQLARLKSDMTRRSLKRHKMVPLGIVSVHFAIT
ncbi:hypothetical protein BSKO_10364 [Bryopsis sp. KO-2023]|nr:hypothetical protein BSKO_10364 [Bryopsis sp. KO-2023]